MPEAVDVVGLCQDLIRIKSVNPPGNELEAARFAGDILERAGFRVDLVDHGNQRGSLLAVLKGRAECPAVLYTGHLDVVPANPAEWAADPFSGQLSAGKVWGRGASDMKGGVAALISAAVNVAASQPQLNGNLILALTAGEETDCLGAAEILKRFTLKPVKAIFIAEPTNNEVFVAEKGALWVEVTTRGRAGHISRSDEARNALELMLKILTSIMDSNPSVTPHPLVGSFARSINTIISGDKTNTIPSECIATIDQRTIPGQDHRAILRELERIIAEQCSAEQRNGFGASLKILLDNPPLETSFQDSVVQLFASIVAETTGDPQKPRGLGYFTDAVKFVPALGAPFVICGPGDPTQNHQANEHVTAGRLIEAVEIYTKTAIRMLT